MSDRTIRTPLASGTLGRGVDEAVSVLRNRDPRPCTVLASEADYDEGVRCVVMPCCGFMFADCHTDDRSDPPTYTCPLCVPQSPTHPEEPR